jgi:uncharacterized caspase-like protein
MHHRITLALGKDRGLNDDGSTFWSLVGMSNTMTTLYRVLFCLVLSTGFACSDLGSVKVLAQGDAADNPRAKTLYVLAVGISRYQYHNAHDPLFKHNPLFAAKDAKDFSSAVNDVAGGTFDAMNIHLLQDQEATRQGIQEAIVDIVKTAKPQDTFIFFYSGHGLSYKGGPGGREQFYLIPSDYNPFGGSDEINTTGISSGLLQTWFLNIMARHQIIILDSSKSSRGFEEFTSRLNEDYTVLQPFVERDMVLISIRDTSFEFSTLGNGLLTHVLLKGMNGGAALAGGEITAKGLVEYTKQNTSVVLTSLLTKSNSGSRNAARIIKNDPHAGESFVYTAGGDFTIGITPGVRRSVNDGQHLSTSGRQAVLKGSRIYNPLLHNLLPVNYRTSRGANSEDGEPFRAGGMPLVNSPRLRPQGDDTFIPKSKCLLLSEVVLTDASSARARKDLALLIAIDTYDNWNPQLSNPVFDAETIAHNLRVRFGFDVEIVRNPDAECVIDVLLKYKNRLAVPDDGQLFIFFAGHGTYHPDEGEGFLIARDSKAPSADITGSSYIRQSWLRNIVESIPFKHIFVVIDACYGGAFEGEIRTRNAEAEAASANAGLRDSSSSSAGANGTADDQFLTDLQIVDLLMQFKTRRFLTSGAFHYVSDGMSGHHSPFAAKFLAALGSPAVEHSFITIEDIMLVMKFMQPVPVLGEISTNDHRSDFFFFCSVLVDPTCPRIEWPARHDIAALHYGFEAIPRR